MRGSFLPRFLLVPSLALCHARVVGANGSMCGQRIGKRLMTCMPVPRSASESHLWSAEIMVTLPLWRTTTQCQYRRLAFRERSY